LVELVCHFLQFDNLWVTKSEIFNPINRRFKRDQFYATKEENLDKKIEPVVNNEIQKMYPYIEKFIQYMDSKTTLLKSELDDYYSMYREYCPNNRDDLVDISLCY
jgi:hypothetical protein